MPQGPFPSLPSLQSWSKVLLQRHSQQMETPQWPGGSRTPLFRGHFLKGTSAKHPGMDSLDQSARWVAGCEGSAPAGGSSVASPFPSPR